MQAMDVPAAAVAIPASLVTPAAERQGVLQFSGGRLSFVSGGLALFDEHAPAARVRFPWYCFGTGMHIRVGRKHVQVQVPAFARKACAECSRRLPGLKGAAYALRGVLEVRFEYRTADLLDEGAVMTLQRGL